MITFDYNIRTRKANIICDESLLKRIRSKFSVKNEGAIHARRKGIKTVDRFYAISPKGTFGFGIYQEIEKYLTTLNIIGVQYSESFQELIDCGVPWKDVWDGLKFPMRYYQKDIVQVCLTTGYGVSVLGTGGGKSLAQANLIENFWRISQHPDTFKCILIVPGLSLVTQMQDDFKEYGVSFTYSGWTGKTPLQDTNVVIVNTENLNSQFGNHPWITEVDLVLGDECHKYNSDAQISKLIEKIKTPHKFGFTGTLSKNVLDTWKTMSIFGPVIFVKNSKELRDEGYLTDIVAKVIKVIHPPLKKKMDYQTELSYVYNSDLRNNFIRKLAKKLDTNTLILVNHLEQGENLLRILSTIEGKQVYFVKGETELGSRTDIIEAMEVENNIICIAMNKIFSTGINVKNIHNIILAGLGKSFLEIVQGIGRGLRLHESKSKLWLLDISDDLKYSLGHAEERKIIYDSEQINWSETEIIL